MQNKNVTINISSGTVFKVIGILLVLALAYYIRDIILMIFVAFILAEIIEPLVNYLEQNKVPRVLGAIIVFVSVIFFLFFLVWMIVPPIAEQVRLLIINFPDLWDKIIENLTPLKEYSQDHGWVQNIQQNLDALQTSLQSAVTGIYSLVISVFRSVINFIVILVLTFYLILTKDVLPKVIKAVSPTKFEPRLIEVAGLIEKKIGAWARAELLLGSIVGLAAFAGLLFLLPKYSLVLALIAGVTELIPYLGPTLGSIPAVFLAFMVPPVSLWRGLGVIILFIIIQELEHDIIVPQVMKKQVGLNPVVVIIAMLIGARLAGIIGVILAIPVATALGIIYKEIFRRTDASIAKAESD